MHSEMATRAAGLNEKMEKLRAQKASLVAGETQCSGMGCTARMHNRLLSTLPLYYTDCSPISGRIPLVGQQRAVVIRCSHWQLDAPIYLCSICIRHTLRT